jgi:hypothetical protein
LSGNGSALAKEGMKNMASLSESQNRRQICSFCGRDNEEVRKLISGPSVYICDECIKACNAILDDEDGQRSEKESGSSVANPSGIKEVLAWLDKNSFRVIVAKRPRLRFSLSR